MGTHGATIMAFHAVPAISFDLSSPRRVCLYLTSGAFRRLRIGTKIHLEIFERQNFARKGHYMSNVL